MVRNGVVDVGNKVRGRLRSQQKIKRILILYANNLMCAGGRRFNEKREDIEIKIYHGNIYYIDFRSWTTLK